MKIKAILYGVTTDERLENLTEDEKREVIDGHVRKWASEYLTTSWKEISKQKLI